MHVRCTSSYLQWLYDVIPWRSPVEHGILNGWGKKRTIIYFVQIHFTIYQLIVQALYTCTFNNVFCECYPHTQFTHHGRSSKSSPLARTMPNISHLMQPHEVYHPFQTDTQPHRSVCPFWHWERIVCPASQIRWNRFNKPIHVFPDWISFISQALVNNILSQNWWNTPWATNSN